MQAAGSRWKRRRRRGGPAGLLLLLLLLPSTLPGRGSDPAESPPQPVTGLLGGSVELPLKLPPTAPVSRIQWLLRRGSGPEILLAELRDGTLEWHRVRFRQRLEVAGNTTLRIGALEQEDSGLWKARVLLATGEVHKQTFRLSVYDPVPDPWIHPQLVSKTAEGCNVTLQCLASGKGAFHISWRRVDKFSILKEQSSRHQLPAKGPDLHMSWQPDSSDSTITCLVSNPVDQKSVSLDLHSFCLSEGHPRMMWFLLPAVLLPFLAAGLKIYLWRKRPSQEAVSPTMLEKKEGSPELQYAELQKRRRPPRRYS